MFLMHRLWELPFLSKHLHHMRKIKLLQECVKTNHTSADHFNLYVILFFCISTLISPPRPPPTPQLTHTYIQIYLFWYLGKEAKYDKG